MSYNKKPDTVIIDGVKYKINTDYRNALKCEEIAQDEGVNDIERALGVVYVLFGEVGLKSNHINQLYDSAIKYLTRGVEAKGKSSTEPDMDYKQDWGWIKASFLSDYGIMIDDVNMHYYDFLDYMSGFTEKSALSNVRYIRNFDTKDLKGDELKKWRKMKKEVALKKTRKMTDKEKASIDRKSVV